MNETRSKIGEQIKAARVAAMLTQAQLAMATGLSKGAIDRVERGEVANSDVIARIAKALNITPDKEEAPPPRNRWGMSEEEVALIREDVGAAAVRMSAITKAQYGSRLK